MERRAPGVDYIGPSLRFRIEGPSGLPLSGRQTQIQIILGIHICESDLKRMLQRAGPERHRGFYLAVLIGRGVGPLHSLAYIAIGGEADKVADIAKPT